MGNLFFDPLNLKPEDADELKVLETKELNNGRLAMIAIAAFTAQVRAQFDRLLCWGRMGAHGAAPALCAVHHLGERARPPGLHGHARGAMRRLSSTCGAMQLCAPLWGSARRCAVC